MINNERKVELLKMVRKELIDLSIDKYYEMIKDKGYTQIDVFYIGVISSVLIAESLNNE